MEIVFSVRKYHMQIYLWTSVSCLEENSSTVKVLSQNKRAITEEGRVETIIRVS